MMAYIWKGNEKIVFSDYGGIADLDNSSDFCMALANL